MRFGRVLSILPVLLVSCGSKGAVSLTVDIPQAVLQVQESPLDGAVVSGSFDLLLTLGGESSGSTTVTPGNFSLQTESGAPLVPLLSVQKDTNFPLVIDKGASRTVTFTLTGDGVVRDQVCPGPVRIVGSVMDTLKNGTDPVTSRLITPTCVPTT